MSQPLDRVFAALADPTRRFVLDELAREGACSVPALARELPITRQAVAKHLAALGEAGLVERVPGRGRTVLYRPREGALRPAADWLRQAEAAWDARLGRLKAAVEGGRPASGSGPPG